MSKITEGQVDIGLGGETICLKQSIDAALKIDRHFDTIGAAIQAVLGLNIDAMCFVIASGSGRSMDAKLRESVWRSRVDIAEGLLKYLAIMRNGGKPIQPAADDEGNALG